MPFSLSLLKENNSELLNLLTKNLPDMLWVKDIMGNYIYANQAICDGLLMAKDTQEPIGKGDVFFAMRERELHKDKPQWHTFGELCFNSDQDVIDNNRAMKFEEYGNVKGKLLYLEVFKAPFYDKDKNILGTVGSGRDITQLKKIQTDLEKSLKILDLQREQLEYQANHDALTSLPNRVLFMDRLEQSIKLAQIEEQKVAVVFIDLDHFKEINDSLGHHIGDRVIIEITSRIKKIMRKSDTLSRLGGDEFCIIVNDVTCIDDISIIIFDLMSAVKEPILIDKHSLYITMSIGISMYPNDGIDASTLLKDADAAMYKAKENGRNTYSFYNEEMTHKALQRVQLETALREALVKDEFVVYFQAQIDAHKNKIVGMEALVRWIHPTMGLIAPDEFIPLAESTGMIVELDRIVMKKAIKEFSLWHKEGLKPGKLSMNLAMKQIEESDFLDFINGIIENKECLADHIEFEVTETQIMKNPQKSIKTLESINSLGISIVIDDFGTGYSSLSYLKKLPIDKLKIDKSFIDGLPFDTDDVAIAKTIINLAKNLNLKVIAEGVETQKQNNFLVENGCDLIQGYLYSKPISADKMREF